VRCQYRRDWQVQRGKQGSNWRDRGFGSTRVPRIEATRLHCTRSEEVEECGRRLFGDGLVANRVVKAGQRVLGVGGGAEWGLGWRPTGFPLTRTETGFLCLLSPRQLYEANKWVHTSTPAFCSVFRLGSACSQGSAITLSPLDFATSGESIHASPSLISARKRAID
jgi:hypothetical protein